MQDISSLSELGIIIGAGVISAFIAVKLRLPNIVGYLLAGLMLSLLLPASLHSQFTEQIAQIGAAFLLFTIGIEFSLHTLKRVSNIVVTGAIVQALIVVAASFVLLPLLGFDSYTTFFVGILVSTSSTAFVVKMLEQRDEMQTHRGEVMLGWLIVQDILVVVWFLLLEGLSPTAADTGADFLGAILKSILVIALAFGLGQFVLPPLLKEVAKTNSEELLLLASVAIIAVFAVFANSLGVSFTIGAFLAGLALSESFLNHEVFLEVKPLRNLFIMIFFVSVGSLFNISAVFNNLGALLLILFGLLTVKVVSIVVICLWFGMHIKNAIRVGLGISQIGEFAFLGAQIGLASGWIDNSIYSLLVASTLVSMAFTPVLYANADWIYRLLEKNIKRNWPRLYRSLFLGSESDRSIQRGQLKDHVILCGFGRVGSYIAAAMQNSDLEFVLIELDVAKAEEAKKMGLQVIYGDSSNADILTSAGIAQAKVLVVALPNKMETSRVVALAKELNPQLKVVARLASQSESSQRHQVDHVVEPEFEAAVQIISTLYKLVKRRNKRVIETVQELRASEIKASEIQVLGDVV